MLPAQIRVRRSPIARVRRAMTPPRLLVVSFAGLVLLATLGLKLLPGLYTGAELGWMDALFTATSAVCITGLVVVDTATYFTGWGQAYLLLLIQIGALGILTFTTMIIVMVGGRLSLHHEAITASQTVSPEVDFRRLVRSVFRLTLMFEAAGAVFLFASWAPEFGVAEGAWHAVFHAVSAFSNAGFSTFSDSMVRFRDDAGVLGTMMALIVVGGLGFLVLEELRIYRRRQREGEPMVLSLHTRLVLVTSLVLVLLGWVVYAALEWFNTLAGMPVWARLLNSLFMSVTARSAGFNTVSYVDTSDTTNFFTVLMMSIGGSPGSTAGGFKTTTVAVLGLLALSRLMGRDVTSVLRRSIPKETIERAVGLFVVAFGTVTVAIMLYTMLQIGEVSHRAAPGAFITYMFEAASAFSTAGLSMGVTPELSPASRLLTIFLMYVGRVGPLSFAAALVLHQREHAGEFRYSYEDVIVG